MRALRYLLPAAALACVPAFAAPPPPDPRAWADKLTAAFERGDPEQIDPLIAEEAMPDADAIKASPDLLLALARTTAIHVPVLGARGSGVADAVADWIMDLAAKDPEEGPKPKRTPVGLRAAAAAHGTRARHDLARGTRAGSEEWLLAADQTIASYAGPAAPDGGEAVAIAMEWMREAMLAKDVDAPAILLRVASLERLAEGFPAGPFPAATKAGAQLIRLQQAVRATPPPAPASLQADVDDVLRGIDPYLKGPVSIYLGTLHNDAVTFARSNKVVPTVAADYILAPRPPGLTITWQLPLSLHWRNRPQSKESDNKDTFVGAFDQTGPEGRLVRRALIQMFRWEKAYAFPEGGKAKGDSPHDLAAADRQARKKAFSKIVVDKDVQKGAVSGAMPAADYYEMAGLDAAKRPLRVRVHVMRGHENKGTFSLTIVDEGTLPPGDPEMDAVYATFLEVKVR